jgi:hypothetical protein
MVHLAMCLAGLSSALRLAKQPRFIAAVNGLDDARKNFLLVGALLVISCFFTAQNIGYRSVHLVMIMPSLLALARSSRGSGLLQWSPFLVLALLWTEGWRYWFLRLGQFVGVEDASWRLSWAMRELAWWIVIPILIACVTVLLVHSEMGRIVFRKNAKRSDAPELAGGT